MWCFSIVDILQIPMTSAYCEYLCPSISVSMLGIYNNDENELVNSDLFPPINIHIDFPQPDAKVLIAIPRKPSSELTFLVVETFHSNKVRPTITLL